MSSIDWVGVIVGATVFVSGSLVVAGARLRRRERDLRKTLKREQESLSASQQTATDKAKLLGKFLRGRRHRHHNGHGGWPY